MRGSGGNVNRFLPGVGVHVNDRKGGTTGRDKWLELFQKREMCASHAQSISVKGACVCVCVCLLRHCVICEEPACCGEGEMLELLVGRPFFNGEDACQLCCGPLRAGKIYII